MRAHLPGPARGPPANSASIPFASSSLSRPLSTSVAGQVELILRARVEDHGAGRRRHLGDHRLHVVADGERVGVVERRVEAHDQHAGHRRVLGMAGRGPRTRRARRGRGRATRRAAGSIGRPRRGASANRPITMPCSTSISSTPAIASTPNQNSTGACLAEPLQLARGDDVPDRVDDQRGQHRLGQRGEQRREEEQGHDRHDPGHQVA